MESFRGYWLVKKRVSGMHTLVLFYHISKCVFNYCRVAAPMEVKLRPKGLGLGADRTVLENAAKALTKPKDGEEELKVVVGANVQLLSGKHQGLYGQVCFYYWGL